ncbi:MAG: nucleotidyltransferase domain-containing protein [Asgard group archaeon]|nr:nucleotidyltransferase domain-containing protein [Asgard group archaeon]
MTDNMQLIQQIAEKLAEEAPEIDLILLYGSFARGLGHELSDYDIIIISDKKKVVWEFILNDRVVKAWSMTWVFAEDTVTGKTGLWITAVAALANSIILWERSKKERKKLEEIIARIPEGGKVTLENSLKWFEGNYDKLWRMRKNIKEGKLVNNRLIIQHTANAICYALSGLNNQYFLNNWGKQLSEIEKLEKKPENFSERYTKLLTADPEEALLIAEGLIEDIRKLLLDWLEKNQPHPDETYKEIASEWPSMVEGLNAIKSAAKNQNITAGIIAVADFIEFVFWSYMILENKTWNRSPYYPIDVYLKKLPEEIRKDAEVLLCSVKLDELAKSAERITKDMNQRLLAKGAKLPIAKSLDEGLQFLQQNVLE